MTLRLQDFIDMEQFQGLQDRLNEIYSFPSAIIDNDGNVLTATAWQDVCTKFHRQNAECEKECIKSDQYILSHLHEANPAVSYQCPHGLVDNATPIIIDGVHYGNYFTGQFFLEPPDTDFFRAQAQRYGFDEEAYIDAVKKVPIWSQQQLDSYLFFIKGLIEVIAEVGAKSLRELETRKKIQESAERYRSILQTAMDGYWRVDMQGNLLEVNDAYSLMSGYSKKELLSMSISDLEAAEIPEDTAVHIQKIISQGMDRFESRHRRKDGSYFYIEVSVQFRPSDDNGQMVAFVRDITERKQAEEEKTKLENQLQQAQKMESVGRLAGGVAHDFNNLLTVILGGAYLALNEVDPGQPLHEYITSIQKAAEKSADLTQQLLAFARKQTIMPKILDLNQTVTDMIKMLKRLIGEDIELSWKPEAKLWPVKADPSQIDQILANLCVNARDSIFDIGKITIQTGNRTVDEGYRAVHADFTPGEYVKISVCDNGCGMDKETLAQIFEPFFTTKGVSQGTGLGLATVYGAVRQNNGFINVYSEPGLGTTFTIYLPRYVGSSDQKLTNAQAQQAPMGLETILLVEDEPSILNMTTMILTKQGYTVVMANCPAEATRLAGELSGEIDLLITDVVMPEMNGKDLANNLMSLYPKLKCLYMSGYTANVIAHHGVLDEGMHFIQKPFSLPDLAIKVREVLDSN